MAAQPSLQVYEGIVFVSRARDRHSDGCVSKGWLAATSLYMTSLVQQVYLASSHVLLAVPGPLQRETECCSSGTHKAFSFDADQIISV
jgi:hypothetical protein